VTPEDGWARLDPRMLAVGPVLEVMRFVPLLVVALIAGSRGDGQPWWLFGTLAVVIGIGVLRWVTTRYRITEERIEVNSGLLFRQHRSVPRDRVRTVDVTARLPHRVFGLGVLRVGTAQHDTDRSGELTLDAVSAAEAERLRRLLLDRSAPLVPPTPAAAAAQTPSPTHEGDTGPGAAAQDRTGVALTQLEAPQAQPQGQVLARLDWAWLRYAPLTLLGIAAVGATAGGAWQLLNQAGVDLEDVGTLRRVLDWLSTKPVTAALATGLLAVLVVGAVGSIVLYVEAWWGYRLTREPDHTLLVRRGLLTTRSVSLEERRLRGVEVDEPLLLRAGRGARANAVATGARGGDRSSLLPPAPRAEAHRVTAVVLREPQPPTQQRLRRHPTAALRRRLVRSLAAPALATAALVTTAAAGTFPWWPAVVVAAVTLPLAVLLGVDRYRSLGHELTAHDLVMRSGSLDRRTVALRRTGIIGWRVSQSVFQRRAGLATATAVTAAGAGAYSVLDIDAGRAAELVNATLG
jgi:putative membrane protein